MLLYSCRQLLWYLNINHLPASDLYIATVAVIFLSRKTTNQKKISVFLNSKMKNWPVGKAAPLIGTAERLHSLNNSLSLLIIITDYHQHVLSLHRTSAVEHDVVYDRQLLPTEFLCLQLFFSFFIHSCHWTIHGSVRYIYQSDLNSVAVVMIDIYV